jgi:hypothetical protein
MIMKKVLAGVTIFIIGLICGLIFTHGSIHAQESVVGGDSIMSKLKEISAGQAEMMASLNAMKEDVQTIKLRITQMQ